MKLNATTTAEDARRSGIILMSAGLVAGFLEAGQVLSAGLLTGVGLVRQPGETMNLALITAGLISGLGMLVMLYVARAQERAQRPDDE